MRPAFVAVVAGFVALAGCGDPNLLGPPIFSNTVDTVSVYAASGTEVWLPSGYALTERRPVRLDRSTLTDFAFDIRNGLPVLVPGAKVGQPGSGGVDPGLKPAAGAFEQIVEAEVNGYVTQEPVEVRPGDVLYVRGRIPPICFFGLPVYAKLEVLEIDVERRRVQFQILVNANCGYKGLEPGLPGR